MCFVRDITPAECVACRRVAAKQAWLLPGFLECQVLKQLKMWEGWGAPDMPSFQCGHKLSSYSSSAHGSRDTEDLIERMALPNPCLSPYGLQKGLRAFAMLSSWQVDTTAPLH